MAYCNPRAVAVYIVTWITKQSMQIVLGHSPFVPLIQIFGGRHRGSDE